MKGRRKRKNKTATKTKRANKKEGKGNTARKKRGNQNKVRPTMKRRVSPYTKTRKKAEAIKARTHTMKGRRIRYEEDESPTDGE